MELHLSDLAAIQLHSCTCKQHRRNSNILQCCSLDLCENSRTRGRHHPMAARSHPRGCAEVTVSRARHRQHAHESGHAGGLDPGPSTREMAAIPLHHVPMEYLRKWAHTPQSISVLVVEYRVPSLLLLCFWCVSCVCVCVCCRGCLLGLAADWVPCRAAGKSMGQPPSQRAGQQHCARKRSLGGSNSRP